MTDLEISQKAKLEKINVIAEKIGLTEDDYEQYGKYKAKVNLDVLERNADKKDAGRREIYGNCRVDTGIE